MAAIWVAAAKTLSGVEVAVTTKGVAVAIAVGAGVVVFAAELV